MSSEMEKKKVSAANCQGQLCSNLTFVNNIIVNFNFLDQK